MKFLGMLSSVRGPIQALDQGNGDDHRELKAGALGSAAACLQDLMLPSFSLLMVLFPGLLILGATDP